MLTILKSRRSASIVAGLLLLLASRAVFRAGAHPQDADAQAHPHAEHGVVEAMTGDHHHGHGGAHMKLTASRATSKADQGRAEEIVKALRSALERYKDSGMAEQDGYRPFLPHLPLPEYHFTNYRYGFLEAFTFNPARPTSLLYRKVDNRYELVGAMYTAPKRFAEDQLNARVPLSVAQWHAHVNICMPEQNATNPDWAAFGFKGTIADRSACEKAGGRFFPQLFGWMVHVYPYEREPSRIWAHRMSK